MLRSGNRAAVLLAAGALAASCIHYGFAGGGLPANIKSIAVLPFENETPAPALQQELHDRLRQDLEGRLGLRDAVEARADAVVRGRILAYDPDIPVAYSADPSQSTAATRRRLRVTIDVEIVDQTKNRTLWSRKGLAAEADYNERAEDDGRRQALKKIVDDIVAGAQSQW
jgi:hypothetical protein